MADTKPGMAVLDNAIAVMQQFNLLLGGAPALIALGLSIVKMFEDAGMTTEEAKAKVTTLRGLITKARDYNAQWLVEHPRVPGA